MSAFTPEQRLIALVLGAVDDLRVSGELDDAGDRLEPGARSCYEQLKVAAVPDRAEVVETIGFLRALGEIPDTEAIEPSVLRTLQIEESL